jgi:hypothetical protein
MKGENGANERRTDNTIDKRQKTKRTNNDLQSISQKQKIEPYKSS